MQGPKEYVRQKFWKRAMFATMRNIDPDSDEAVSLRCRILREAMMPGSTQTAFALKLNVSVSRWNNVETGSPLGRDMATKIVKKFPGITYDWLWHGDLLHVPMVRQTELEEAEKRIQAELETTGKRKTSAPKRSKAAGG